MMDKQGQQVKHHHEEVNPRQETSVLSWGEGPSEPKGKMVDLCKWGNLNLSNEGLSIEAQTAALNFFKMLGIQTILRKKDLAIIKNP